MKYVIPADKKKLEEQSGEIQRKTEGAVKFQKAIKEALKFIAEYADPDQNKGYQYTQEMDQALRSIYKKLKLSENRLSTFQKYQSDKKAFQSTLQELWTGLNAYDSKDETLEAAYSRAEREELDEIFKKLNKPDSNIIEQDRNDEENQLDALPPFASVLRSSEISVARFQEQVGENAGANMSVREPMQVTDQNGVVHRGFFTPEVIETAVENDEDKIYAKYNEQYPAYKKFLDTFDKEEFREAAFNYYATGEKAYLVEAVPLKLKDFGEDAEKAKKEAKEFINFLKTDM